MRTPALLLSLFLLPVLIPIILLSLQRFVTPSSLLPRQEQQQPRSLITATNNIPKHFTYKILASFPHPVSHFTQGFTFRSSDGALLEGTGLEGQSALYEWDMDANNDPLHPSRAMKLPGRHFGEGIAEYRGKIFQLTWQNGKIYVSNPETMELISTLSMPSQLSEGWGACISPGHDALILSDGSARIFWYGVNSAMDKLTHLKSVEIRDCSQGGGGGKLVGGLNELEMVPLRITHPEEACGDEGGGLVWANIYGSSCIVVADPTSGLVRAYVHLDGLNPNSHGHDNVYNGIAFRNLDDTLWVTGKLWDRLYKIKLVEATEGQSFASCTTLWNPPYGVRAKEPYNTGFKCAP